MSQTTNTEWRNVRLDCKHVEYRVSGHPTTWDACCSSLEANVLLFGQQPLSTRRSVDGKSYSSSTWCTSFSIKLSKTPQGIGYLDPR
jgi:hypothetical protein